MTAPVVSVIVPCRNEARYIGPCLESLLSADYPAERLEILVVDGMSDDGTAERVREFAGRDARVRLLLNPKRIVPCAMNVGLAAARGDVIMRMDAHSDYPPNYIPALVGWLERTGADNVGGACHTVPADDSPTAQAIALALAHPFGIGNAWFRRGVTAPTRVDTVPFGCFRPELFRRIGGFDEELVRNQDDELNFRILRHGGSVLLVPDVVCRYYARSSFRQLGRTYYQYGLFKPLVAYKIGRVMTARQLAPPAFVLTLLICAAAAPWSMAARVALGLVILAYATVALGMGLNGARGRGARTGALLAGAFATLHISYGLGFLAGTIGLAVRRWRPGPEPAAIPLSR
jgi:glycosyltransferase involved in cell wall biosynthesis